MHNESGPVARDRHNEIIRNPTVLTLVRHLARRRIDFSSDKLVDHFSGIAEFPFFTARGLIEAASAAGVELAAGKISLEDANGVDAPFLTYMESLAPDDSRVQLVEVLRVAGDKILVSDGPMGLVETTRNKIAGVWTGVTFVVRGAESSGLTSELKTYRDSVKVLPDLLSVSECAELIEYCERHAFRRSRILNDDTRQDQSPGVIVQKVRNSTSTMLDSREHHLLARLYAAVAHMDGSDERDVEQIQCVRYKKGQRFTSHYDAAPEVPRRTTYLLYLNDNFNGGATHFPMLDLDVQPQTGSCLRFANCDDDGRILWQSEHGGLPVSDGTKYALNIWVHLPPPPM